MINMSIGTKIKELRKSKKLSQAEFGKRIGVSQTTVTAWETGRAEPTSSYIASVADYFHVTTDYLLGRDGKEGNSVDTKDLAEIMDSIMTYNGKELNQHDKDVVEGLISAYLNNKA